MLECMSYKRLLLKLSGEAFSGDKNFGIDHKKVNYFAREIANTYENGHQVAVLVGGGNFFRGSELSELGFDRTTADYMGMLSTVINGLSLLDSLEKLGIASRLVCSLRMDEVAEPYIRRKCIRHLERNRVIILTAGLGRPFFSTDTAAVQRALEIGADVVLKATRVKGVYDKDPEKHKDARFFESLSFDEAISLNLGILDQTAFALCRDNNLPLIVFNIFEEGNLRLAANGEKVGTLLHL